VQPKDTVEERRKLATVVPPLLKRLAAGLKAAEIGDEVREAFFAELMRLHTAIMSAPPKDANAPAPAPAGGGASLDFSAKITMKNPFGGGDVQVAGLDPEGTVDGTPRGRWDATNPDNLKQGDWLEFKTKAEGEEEKRQPARLIFISPRKTRYIFADRGEKDYIECTRAEITRRLRSGEAVLMEDEPEVPFFDRIMGGVLAKMKGAA
jgi:hypothetical protein